MGWFNYYKLLEKYNGDLTKASKAEMQSAADWNPNNAPDARKLAEEKWKENELSRKEKHGQKN